MKVKISVMYRVLALVLVLFVSWRLMVLGMSEHYVRQALEGDVTALDKALSWNGSHPKALYLKAKQLVGTDPEQAERLLKKSILENPVDGRPVAVLAQLMLAKGETEKADALMDQAIRLMPAHKTLRLYVARYWAQRERWGKALDNWRAALTTDPALGKEIFPVLLQVAEIEAARPLLKSLTQDPPAWWDQFFDYLAQKVIDPETLITVATMRHLSDVPLSKSERKSLVGRLQKDGQWPEAYLVWINGLTDEQRRHLGGIYDGGFELAPANEGFGWHFPTMKGLLVNRQHTYDIQGKKALHLIFKDKEMRFHHLYQPLFIAPGNHVFRARVRTDRLQTRGGLKWVLRCAGDTDIVLGESNRLLGSSEWRMITFRFAVPESSQCSGQLLRLESTGRNTYDHKLKGEIWFDRLAIRSVRDD